MVLARLPVSDPHTVSSSPCCPSSWLGPQKVLTDEELQRLGDLGRRLEELHGVAQDIEWAMVGEEIYLLQSRPVTTM